LHICFVKCHLILYKSKLLNKSLQTFSKVYICVLGSGEVVVTLIEIAVSFHICPTLSLYSILLSFSYFQIFILGSENQ
jgi:hypothetical protein